MTNHGEAKELRPRIRGRIIEVQVKSETNSNPRPDSSPKPAESPTDSTGSSPANEDWAMRIARAMVESIKKRPPVS